MSKSGDCLEFSFIVYKYFTLHLKVVSPMRQYSVKGVFVIVVNVVNVVVVVPGNCQTS